MESFTYLKMYGTHQQGRESQQKQKTDAMSS